MCGVALCNDGMRSRGLMGNRYGFDKIAGEDQVINFDEWFEFMSKEKKTYPQNQK